jgi:hypothetical protein
VKPHSPAAKTFDAGQCPLCGQPNDCQLCTIAAYKGPCWCAAVKIPEELIAQIPPESRNKTCVCLTCVMKFHRSKENTLGIRKSRNEIKGRVLPHGAGFAETVNSNPWVITRPKREGKDIVGIQ